jgi:hypothetical protein
LVDMFFIDKDLRFSLSRGLVQSFGIVARSVWKTLSAKQAFIALGLTAGNKRALIRRRRTRAVVPYSAETALGSLRSVGRSSLMAAALHPFMLRERGSFWRE